MKRPPPRLFLSYSSRDGELARRLATDLEAHGCEVWLDQWRLEVGQPFEQPIEQGIGEAELVLVLLTSHSVASSWVEREWRLKIEEEATSRSLSVIPVIGEPCPIPDVLAGRSAADVTGGGYDAGVEHLVALIRHLRGEPEALEPSADLDVEMAPFVEPISVDVADGWLPLFEEGAFLDRTLPEAKAAWESRLGIPLPGVRFRGDASLGEGFRLVVSVEEVPAAVRELTSGTAAILLDVLEGVVLELAESFVDPDTVAWMVESVDTAALARVVPEPVSWTILAEVVRRLVAEGVRVDLPRIVRTWADEGLTPGSSAALAEQARHVLRDVITASLARNGAPIPILDVGPRITATFTAHLHVSEAGESLALPPEAAQATLAAIRAAAGPGLVLRTTEPAHRRYLRRLVELELPRLPVVSTSDLAEEHPVDVRGIVDLAEDA
ncbi:MAG: TIR domain-containing protein [Myxococcota bacterium]